jgi:hypothetical protein
LGEGLAGAEMLRPFLWGRIGHKEQLAPLCPTCGIGARSADGPEEEDSLSVLAAGVS